MKIKLSKSQWKYIGKKAGWIPRDPTDISDADLGPIMTPDEEEDVLLGPEDSYDPFLAYKEGYKRGLEGVTQENYNPYRVDTEEGIKKFDQWRQGFKDAKEGKKPVYEN